MIGSGVSHFIEIGPGRALSSMVKRIDRSVDTDSVGDLDSILKLRRN
jgi:[acyl-carrier-protein] S-malonyltransferase